MIASREYVKDLITKVLSRYTRGYCKLGFINNTTGSVNTSINPNGDIPFNKFLDGNLDYNLTNHSIKLKAGRSYNLKCVHHYTSGASYILGFYDLTNKKYLGTSMRVLGSVDESNLLEDIYTPETDCEVTARLYWSSANQATVMRVSAVNTSAVSLGLAKGSQEVVFMVVEI